MLTAAQGARRTIHYSEPLNTSANRFSLRSIRPLSIFEAFVMARANPSERTADAAAHLRRGSVTNLTNCTR
jgi:hypothetical protein